MADDPDAPRPEDRAAFWRAALAMLVCGLTLAFAVAWRFGSIPPW